MSGSKAIAQTVAWIKSVVIGCNFCPFAAKPMLQKQIRYVLVAEATKERILNSMLDEFHFLDETTEIETTLLIFPNHFSDFTSYLALVSSAEKLLSKQGYDGIYQVASFHPDYCFAGADQDDPANYTNRSPYPMLHLIREESITNALKHYKDPEGIPGRNVDFAREKGLAYMQLLRAACLQE
ncbi:MAG: DUF1415 domain-containing protein [Saprospiraceae bacterium]|nr:DUF1415 domain-containing protein [Candidatus Opimibacter iunctus]